MKFAFQCTLMIGYNHHMIPSLHSLGAYIDEFMFAPKINKENERKRHNYL